jgi:hypothetical protein
MLFWVLLFFGVFVIVWAYYSRVHA